MYLQKKQVTLHEHAISNETHFPLSVKCVVGEGRTITVMFPYIFPPVTAKDVSDACSSTRSLHDQKRNLNNPFYTAHLSVPLRKFVCILQRGEGRMEKQISRGEYERDAGAIEGEYTIHHQNARAKRNVAKVKGTTARQMICSNCYIGFALQKLVKVCPCDTNSPNQLRAIWSPECVSCSGARGVQ